MDASSTSSQPDSPSLKYCKDCRHYESNWHTPEYSFCRVRKSRSLVTGKEEVKIMYCVDMRMNSEPWSCGLSASLFEPRNADKP